MTNLDKVTARMQAVEDDIKYHKLQLDTRMLDWQTLNRKYREMVAEKKKKEKEKLT